MEVFRQRIPKTTYILWGVCVVGLSLFIYSKLNAPPKDSVYRLALSSIYWLGIIAYFIYSTLSQKIVIFDDCIQCYGQKILFEDIKEIEIEADGIIIYRKSSEKWILLRPTLFKAETWGRLSGQLKNFPQASLS